MYMHINVCKKLYKNVYTKAHAYINNLCFSPVSVGLLDSTCRRRTLPGRFGGQLLPGGFTTGGFTGSLFGTCHGTLMKRSKEKQQPMRTAAVGGFRMQ